MISNASNAFGVRARIGNGLLKIAGGSTRGGRVGAVGTTVVRSLESAASRQCSKPFPAKLPFSSAGYEFKTVDAMLTIFICRIHAAHAGLRFGGYESVMNVIAAVEDSYRFFSYGDAMFG